jgi:hypothetical protein
MNPPYGREIGKWMKKAYESAGNGTVCWFVLFHARTDTRWWHDSGAKRLLRIAFEGKALAHPKTEPEYMSVGADA